MSKGISQVLYSAARISDKYARRFKFFKTLSNKLKLQIAKSRNKSTYSRLLYNGLYEAIKVEKELIVFDSYWGEKVACHPYAIFCEMQKDPKYDGYQYIWVCNAGVKAPTLVKSNPRVSFVPYQSDGYVEALLKASIIITNMTLPIYFSLKPEQKVFNTWHGIPIKKIGRESDNRFEAIANTQRNFNFSEAIFTASKYSTDKIVSANWADLALAKTYEIGSPRIDLTLKSSKKSVRERLGINDNKEIILYAPTWRGSFGKVSSDVMMQLEVIESLKTALSQKYHLFVSLHNFTFKSINKSDVGCTLVPDELDMNEMLAAVDILISDYSSVFVDYLVLDRPVILHVPDLQKYSEERGLFYDLTTLPVQISHTTQELLDQLSAPKKPSTFDNYRTILQTLLPHEDGCASLRALEIIEEIKPSQTSIKKRILIYPGGMLINGITSSIINLSRNLDYEKYDLYLLIDAKITDVSTQRQTKVNDLDSRTRLILRSGKTGVSLDEKDNYLNFLSCRTGKSYSQLDIKKLFDREYKRLLGQNVFDLIIDYSAYGLYWCAFTAFSPSRKKAIWLHSDLFAEANNNDPKRDQKQLNGVFHLYKHFDSISSVSDGVRAVNEQHLASNFGPNANHVIVPNSISLADIKSKSKTPVCLTTNINTDILKDSSIIKFIKIARLSPEKNHKRLIKAFSTVIKSNVNAVLFIVGSGPLSKDLKSYAASLNVAERVIFTGPLNNPFPLLSSCDCFVLSSNYEGQGIVLLEAMALGIPCIATRSPAIESVLNKGGGIVCDQSTDSLAEEMIKFSVSGYSKTTIDMQGYVDSVMQDFYEKICS